MTQNGQGTQNGRAHEHAGDAISISTVGRLFGVLRNTAAILTILTGGIAAVAITHYKMEEKIDTATPTLRFDSLRAVVAHQDTAIQHQDKATASVNVRIDGLYRDVMGINCLRADYPSPFCDTIPRPVVRASSRRLP